MIQNNITMYPFTVTPNYNNFSNLLYNALKHIKMISGKKAKQQQAINVIIISIGKNPNIIDSINGCCVVLKVIL